MIDINNKEEISKLDPKNVYGSTGMFIAQCRQIHEIVESTNLPSNLNPSSVIFSGMGGSAYGGHIAISLFKDEIKSPPFVNCDYGLPIFAKADSLIIPTSYSGSTEESVSAFEKAREIGAKIIVLTSGSKLADLSKSGENISSIVFDPINNPSGQPRLGTGYIVLGTIEILRKTGLIDLNSEDIVKAIDEVDSHVKEVEDAAKSLSQKIMGNIPLIFSGSIFEGNAHILRNQFNETAKSFSSFHFIPEANHHVMEGLKNPSDRKLIALFLESALYDPKIQKRIELTKDVISQNNAETISYKALSSSKLSQSLEFLVFGGYLTFYLGILYGQDPSLIPWVDYFKEKLSQ